ncbi:hypothetical protein PAESOLCIP111_04428 [Paenibacillus solanacearum]|uniref:HTH marR-type domain-containing protein n=1 Tax=Paenibacillus solanacearum TaxID=2048548 RepID=A0A916K499_9BACL|nr:MarR family transcriptional regulator [Paenibacillus solanacearum]CAG7643132.1 hypothetical protein PAESOLCIP111_04428 [Paenibacillus solanacearum]
MKQVHDERLLQEVFEAFTQFAAKIQQDDDEEKAWLLAQCSDPQVQSVLREMTPTMLHVLDAIGKIGRANGSMLSSRFGLLKGTVSKLTKRLAAHGLIVTETIPGNKKELHFAITPQGEKIYKLHKQLDERIRIGASRFMADYTEEQLMFVRDFMHKLVANSFLQFEE